MFENVATEDLLRVVDSHVFDHHDDYMGADRIDAIKAMDLVVRSAQAEQAKQIAELDKLRSSQIRLGRGDYSLSVIGELGMARNPPSTSCREVPPLTVSGWDTVWVRGGPGPHADGRGGVRGRWDQ